MASMAHGHSVASRSLVELRISSCPGFCQLPTALASNFLPSVKTLTIASCQVQKGAATWG